MTPCPSISIVTVSYNQGAYLEKAIRSVLEQRYPKLEYVIIDGGSTDDSVDIIRSYADKLDYWVSEPDRGQSHGLNKGFAHCTGELMGWLNADDYYLPGAFEAFAEAWRNTPQAGGWVGHAEIVDPKGKTLQIQKPGPLDRDSLADWERNGFSQPACLFSREAWQHAGPIDESLYIPMDFDLWMKISSNAPFAPIDLVLAGALWHPHAKTQEQVALKDAETWIVLMRHGKEELARKLILERLTALEQMSRKVRRLTRLPGYCIARPLLKYLLRGVTPAPTIPTQTGRSLPNA